MARPLPHPDTEMEYLTEAGSAFLTPEEGRRVFDEAARTWLGISGEEFLRRYDAGEYADLVESEDNRRIVDLYLMIPLAR